MLDITNLQKAEYVFYLNLLHLEAYSTRYHVDIHLVGTSHTTCTLSPVLPEERKKVHGKIAKCKHDDDGDQHLCCLDSGTELGLDVRVGRLGGERRVAADT